MIFASLCKQPLALEQIAYALAQFGLSSGNHPRRNFFEPDFNRKSAIRFFLNCYRCKKRFRAGHDFSRAEIVALKTGGLQPLRNLSKLH